MWLYERMGVTFVDRRNTTFLMHVELLHPSRIQIGERTTVGRECILDGRGGLTIGRDVNIGGRCQLYTGSHDPQDPEFPAVFKPIEIGDHAWIAIGATILGGVTIGRGAVVAAGSLVTSDLEPMTIYAGVPARKIGVREQEPAYQLNYRPNGF